mgnify:FL=1
MKIEIGDYIIVSDPQCMWIEEKYTGETKDKKPKEYTRRITGYVGNFRQLMENFYEHKIRASRATELCEVLKELSGIESEIKEMIARCKK